MESSFCAQDSPTRYTPVMGMSSIHCLLFHFRSNGGWTIIQDASTTVQHHMETRFGIIVHVDIHRVSELHVVVSCYHRIQSFSDQIPDIDALSNPNNPPKYPPSRSSLFVSCTGPIP